MAELEMEDFIPKGVIEAPLKLDKNMKVMLETLDKIITKSKEQAIALDKANSSTVEVKKMVDALTKEQQQLKLVNDQLQKQITALKDTNDAQAKHSKHLGDLEDALGNVNSGLGGSINRVKELTKAALVFIATPLGLVIAAIGAALFALMAYFKGSEEGQNRLNKIVQVGKAIFEQFMNVVEDVGEAIYNAINNPQQAIKDFGKLLWDNIVTRFKGLMELVPALANSLVLLFKGKFSEAGKVAFDAVTKVGLGVENASDKIKNLIVETQKLVDTGIKAGDKIAKLEAEYDRQSRALIVKRAETEAKVQKLREEAASAEGENKKTLLVEAIKLQRELGAEEVKHAELNLALQKQLLKTNGDDKEALMAVAEAQADVAQARANAYRDTVKFAKEVASIDRQMHDDLLKQLDRIDNFVNRALDGDNKILNSRRDNAEIIARFGERIAKETEARQKKETLTEEQQSKLRAKIRQQELDELSEKGLDFLDDLADKYGYFEGVIGNILSTLTGSRLEEIDLEEKAVTESYQRQIEAAGNNVEQRTRLENAMAAKKSELDRKRAVEERKMAIFEKATNIAQAVMLTAKAVLEYGIVSPLAIAAGIAGAVQIALIASTKIPSYSKGTKRHGGGLARVGEQGPEALLFPDDHVQLSPDGDSIMNLPPGTAVIPHKQTMQLLALSGLVMGNMKGRRDANSELSRHFQELNQTIKNKRETHYNWTRKGLERAFKNGESTRYFMDHFYR